MAKSSTQRNVVCPSLDEHNCTVSHAGKISEVFLFDFHMATLLPLEIF